MSQKVSPTICTYMVGFNDGDDGSAVDVSSSLSMGHRSTMEAMQSKHNFTSAPHDESN